jgi:hypothetical protein
MDAAVEQLKVQLASAAAGTTRAEAEAMMAKAELAQANAQIMMLKAQLAELQGKFNALQASGASSMAGAPPATPAMSIESAFDSLSIMPTTAASSSDATDDLSSFAPTPALSEGDPFSTVAAPTLSALPPSVGGFGDFDSIPSPLAGSDHAR